MRAGSTTVRSLVTLPVLSVPLGSMRTISTSSVSVFGQCSTPRGTLISSPGPTSDRRRAAASAAGPGRPGTARPRGRDDAQTNSPGIFTTLMCMSFRSPTILGFQRSVNFESLSARLITVTLDTIYHAAPVSAAGWRGERDTTDGDRSKLRGEERRGPGAPARARRGAERRGPGRPMPAGWTVAVASAPEGSWAGGIRVWQITSWKPGPPGGARARKVSMLAILERIARRATRTRARLNSGEAVRHGGRVRRRVRVSVQRARGLHHRPERVARRRAMPGLAVDPPRSHRAPWEPDGERADRKR